jgi:hypothetical protein
VHFSTRQPEHDEHGYDAAVIDWDRCATHEAPFFPWPEVRGAWDDMDPNIMRISQKFVVEELGHLGRACPECQRPTAELEWISIGTSDAQWLAGDQRCGWITVCASCAIQVAFVVDDEMTEGRREGNW